MSRLGWRRGVVVVIAVVAVSLAGGRTTTLGPAVKNCRVAGGFSEADSLLDHTGGRSPRRAGDAAVRPAATGPPQKIKPSPSPKAPSEVLYNRCWALSLLRCRALAHGYLLVQVRDFCWGGGDTSSATDVSPPTPTFSFYGSTFIS